MTQPVDFGPETDSSTPITPEEQAIRIGDSLSALLSKNSSSDGSDPTYAVKGAEWLDEQITPNVIRVYDGADWIDAGFIDTVNNLVLYPKKNEITDLTLSNSGDITVGTGFARDSTGRYLLFITTAISKVGANSYSAADWTAGTGNAGWLKSAALTGTVTFTNNSDQVTGSGTSFLTDYAAGQVITGSTSGGFLIKSVESDTALTLVAANTGATVGGQNHYRGGRPYSTWSQGYLASFYVYLLRKNSDGSTDVGLSTCASIHDIPSGYTAYRRIGWVPHSTIGGTFRRDYGGISWRLTTPQLDVSVTNLGTTSVSYALASVPIGLSMKARMYVGVNGAAQRVVHVRNPSDTDTAPSLTAAPLGLANHSTVQITTEIERWTNTLAQIAARADGASTTFRVSVTEIFDPNH